MAVIIGGGGEGFKKALLPELIANGIKGIPFEQFVDNKPIIVLSLNNNEYYVYDYEREVGAFGIGKFDKVRSDTYLEIVVNQYAVKDLKVCDFIKHANANALQNESKPDGFNFVVGTASLGNLKMLSTHENGHAKLRGNGFDLFDLYLKNSQKQDKKDDSVFNLQTAVDSLAESNKSTSPKMG